MSTGGLRRGLAGLAAAALGATALLALAPPAAADLRELRATAASAVSCFRGPTPGAPPADIREVTATVTGIVQARLAGEGDWDLAVYDADTGAVVAGSAGFAANEIAEGFVTAGQRLLVQGCRYAGAAETSRLTVDFFVQPALVMLAGAVPPIPLLRAILLRVITPDRAAKARLQALQLDLTEAGHAGTVQVLARTPADLDALTAAGLDYTVLDPDLAATAASDRRADAADAAAAKRSALPSGSTSYRRLFDYQLELKELAARYPTLTRPVTLAHRTVEGRDVEGLEITRDADRVEDGKPVFVQLGLHHAREWPSGEHTLEFAYDLLRTAKSAKVAALLGKARVIVVPVVNPDGFTISREAPFVGFTGGFEDYQLKRKNCRPADSPTLLGGGSCGANPAGGHRGTDLNRNYGGFWGGPGASADPNSEIFRGGAPFSEPETRNVRDLLSTRQVTVLVSNHTFGDLVLRPPGLASTPAPVDEPIYRALADKLARHNGYTSQPAHELYDTTGTLEDWSYPNTGALSFTFEIGSSFHGRYRESVIEHYLGRKPLLTPRLGGNQAAYYALLKAAADPDLHARVRGTAPRDAVLRLHKTFTTPTSPVQGLLGLDGPPLQYADTVETLYRSRGGRFTLALNPSTRPYLRAIDPAARETWRLTCESADGRILSESQVSVERGEVVRVGRACADPG